MKLVIGWQGTRRDVARLDRGAVCHDSNVSTHVSNLWQRGSIRCREVVQVHSVKDLRIMDLSWPLPSLHADYLTKPMKLLSHWIGHEGAGSILSYLKAPEWANGLLNWKFSRARSCVS
ncbi:hypothetical protein PsorP6_017349 [Peronosclerospora sorghi]|uniref:Uncharacterized protein n=1 Tax=Peronosclerospora sorghi TaxID=230839 RepID=A0ACC0WLL5_9STRA|nr:hypothetical protein PsorP6_018374 [Peronosclerospora sorghi]KAI9919642.1 hypothetical protein PsorP6_017349 [Peronosclerospora sorghi]